MEEGKVSYIEGEFFLMKATMQAALEVMLSKEDYLKVRAKAEEKYNAFIKEAIAEKKKALEDGKGDGNISVW